MTESINLVTDAMIVWAQGEITTLSERDDVTSTPAELVSIALKGPYGVSNDYEAMMCSAVLEIVYGTFQRYDMTTDADLVKELLNKVLAAF